uniref:KIAA2026 ortholog n=1 Tax=Stegastes partitus TaxID=144197 RepID=A0A3B4ZDX4_9TELE
IFMPSTPTMVALHCPGAIGDAAAEGDHLSLSNDGMSEFSNSDLSLPEVCISTNSNSFEEDMNYEVQQAYRIFTGFLLDKHKGITSPFLHPIGHQEAQHGIGGVKGRGQSQLRQSMCLRRMEEKFISQQYETITEFVADFRLMLENCYRYHGVDHWISKQAQKLEIMLEQKLTLLSRTLREKTTLAVTSKGRFGAEEERTSGGTSTRRRLAPRSLATITVGGHESVMVQALRLEEQQRAKEEKRQRELEKKEAEEMSAKEVEEWEQTLLSQASPQTVDTLWELPAIGHFLCLAQTALNLPEIVFFELERCLLMPRCSLLLSKIMSSLLSPPQRRATLHRRPALGYRRWESELRQRVVGWYRAVGASRDQAGRAEQLGLCHQFFSTLGEVSPLEEKPFHLLPFYQRVWLLKGLCDHVYETQKDVQDAVLAQPIHECRESILGYDSKENAYIHFPHFCGADLRIYCQSPSTPPAFPFPSVWVKGVEIEPETEGEESDGLKDERDKNDTECYGVPMDTGESGDFGKRRTETFGIFKKENGTNPPSPTKPLGLKVEGVSSSQGHQRPSCLECCKSKTSDAKTEEHDCCCGTSGLAAQLSSESTQNSSEERMNDKIWTKKKKRKKKRGREQLLRVKGEHKQLQHVDRMRLSTAEASKSAVRKVTTTIKRKDKKKKHKTGKKNLYVDVSPGLVCTSLEELRELISKTEDELDDLESTKKRLGRWYYRREAVKDLHSTLIRLLNELSPWEPKLVKAYQRNRLRLKKEFDDFKMHPEYNNFVREECNSSSSDDDDEEKDLGKEACSLSDHYGRSEEEDLEHMVPRGLWKKTVTCVPPNHLKHPLASTEKGVSLLPRVHAVSSNITSGDLRLQSKSELIPTNQSRDSAWAARVPAQTPVSPRSPILHPTSGLPKGYTPIPTLLAKSVGNKVTLMKRPADSQNSPSIPKNPVQVVYKVPEGLGHLVRKDSSSSSSSPIKISVQPVVDQNTGEKIMQQVVILPSNLLIHKTEAKAPSLHQQQAKGSQVAVSKVASPLCMSTDVPGFSIPENRIPVQQVAPLKDARTVRTPSPSVSPRLQQGSLNTAESKGAQVCSVQASTSQGVAPNPSPITTHSSAVSTDPVKTTDSKQELKTVCIRDSQSILVTTRGGNTGIVKVQTSSDQNALGSFPTSPVITISPQFKAFLVSKTSQTLSTTSSQTSPSAVPAMTSISVAQPQKKVPSVLKPPSPITNPIPCYPTASTTGLDPVTSSITTTTCSHQLFSHGSLTTNSQVPGIPSFSTFSQTSCSTSTAAALPAGNMIKKDLVMPASILSNSSPAQVTTTMESSPAQTSTPTLDRQPSFVRSGTGEEMTPLLSSSQLARNKTQTPLSSAPTTCIPFTTSATGTIQQRIVINTSTPLAAGTQILLNNARFVVPPQGLGPGSHVLIISSPAPQQVPTASATSIGASVPPQGASHATVAPRAPVLPQPPARLPGVPAISSPFVACTPAVRPSLLATTPNVTPVRLAGTPGLGSTLLPSKTNVVSALPRLPTAQTGNFAVPPVGTSSLVSSPPRLGSVPALVSPVATSAPPLSSALATIRLAAGTPMQAECSSTISPAVASPLPRFSGPLSSLPVLPGPSAVALPNPVIPVPAPLSSSAAPVVADTPALHCSLPAQHVVAVTTLGPGIQPQQTAVRIAAPSIAQAQALVHTGLGNTSIKKQVPVLQPVLAGTRTQVLPTVAVPPIVSAVSRMQTLPIATVPPIGSTVSTFETAPVGTAPPSSSTVIITPAQPIASLKANNAIHPPAVLTNQALGKHSLQTSALGLHTNITSKLLISPDGAVLSTVQCQANPAELTACPKPLDALVISTNSSTGALQTHDSSLQPSQTDTK